MKKFLDFGFTAERSKEEAEKSPHPNTCRFLMEVLREGNEFIVYIATECGHGEKRLSTIEEVNEEVSKARKTFTEKGGWTISNFGLAEVEENQ